MRYAIIYWLTIIVLFFSQTYAVTSDTLPVIYKDDTKLWNTNGMDSLNSSMIDNYALSTSIKKIDAPEEVQTLIDYAREKTHSIDFILSVERESWRRGDSVGDWGTSYGLCQRHLHKNWNINNPDPTIANWYAMVDTCRKTWQIKGKDIGNWLHWYKVRNTVRDRFIITK